MQGRNRDTIVENQHVDTGWGMGRMGLIGRVALMCIKQMATGKLLCGKELSLALYDDLEGWKGEV